MLKALRAKGFSDHELSAAGLVSTGQRGVYDRFRGRLVWPIRDVTGQTIGFGARKLYDDDQGPKYLNTPETPIYRKNQVLYGLDLAKRDIAKSDPRRVVIVEGYTDVMACHLAGVTSAIATCGTAFGAEHIKVLRRVMGDDTGAGEVIFTFDGDEAGQKAALRAFSEDSRFTAQTFVAVAPDGLDPCDLRLQRGDGAVRSLMDAKVPLFEFAIDKRLEGFDLATVEGQVGALRAAAPIVAEIRDTLVRPGYERVLARRLGLDPNVVSKEVERAARGARQVPPVNVPAADTTSTLVTLASLPRSGEVLIERDALIGALQYGHQVDTDLLQRAFAIPFRHPALEAVREAVAGATDRSKPGWSVPVIEQVREPYRVLAGELLMAPFPAKDEVSAVTSVAGLANRLIVRELDRQKLELLGAMQRTSAESAEGRALRESLRDLDRERQRFVGS
jgi:DNA primase